MRFTRVELENIRSHTHTQLHLPAGRIVLSGDIGSGKSSILYAIEFALFGLLRGEQPSLLRQQARKGRVTLSLLLNGEEITIQRTLKRTRQGVQQDASVIWRDAQGEHVLTPSEARARIIQLFQYPREYVKSNPLLYRYTIFTPQEQLKQILQANSDERLTLFRKLFQLEKYARARENSLLIARGIQPRHAVERLDEARQRLERLEARLRALEDHLTLLEEDLAQREEALGKAEAAYEAARRKLEEAEHVKRERERLTVEVERVTQRLAQIRQAYAQLKPLLEGETEDVDVLEARVKTLREREAGQQEEVGQLRVMIARLAEREESLRETPPPAQADLSKARERVKHLQGEREARLKERDEARARLSMLRARHALLTERLSTLEASILTARTCPLCGQPISREHREKLAREAESLREELEQLGQEEATLSRQLEATERILHALEEDSRRAEALLREEERKAAVFEAWEKQQEARRGEVERIRQNLSRARERLGRAEDQLTHLRREREAAEEALRRARERLLAEREARLLHEEEERLTEDLRRMEDQLKRLPEVVLGTLQEALREAEAAFRRAREAYDTLRLQRERLITERQNLEEQLKEARKAYEHLLREEAAARADESLKAWLTGFFTPVLERLEAHVLAHILAEFSSRFSFWLRILLPQARAVIQEDFTPIIYLDTPEPLAYTSLSGGERSSVALAYRLALYDTLRMLNHAIAGVLILDEPTEGFSTQQVEALITAFKHLHVEQLILVTHEPLLAEAAETRFLLQKEGDTTTITTTS